MEEPHDPQAVLRHPRNDLGDRRGSDHERQNRGEEGSRWWMHTPLGMRLLRPRSMHDMYVGRLLCGLCRRLCAVFGDQLYRQYFVLKLCPRIRSEFMKAYQLCLGVVVSVLLISGISGSPQGNLKTCADPPTQLDEILGVRTAPGAFVMNVEPGSPADKVGLDVCELIAGFNGQEFRSSGDLA